jgi:hypothetical protein
MFTEIRKLPECTPAEIEEICSINLYTLQRLFSFCKKNCANCEYPLSALEENFSSISAGGEICQACHAMESSVNARSWFRIAHTAWLDEQRAKKKIIDKNNYL